MKLILSFLLTLLILFILGLGIIIATGKEKESDSGNQKHLPPVQKVVTPERIATHQEKAAPKTVHNKGSTPLPVFAGYVLVQSTKGMDEVKKASEEAKQAVEKFLINKTRENIK